MTSIEASIAGLQGKKVRGVEWGDGQYLCFQENEWRYNIAHCRDSPDTEPYNGTNRDTREWEIYNEPLKIEAGKWYRDREAERVYCVGSIPCHLVYGGRKWVLINDAMAVRICRDDGEIEKGMCGYLDVIEECEAPE
jgi:hypothetical protein